MAALFFIDPIAQDPNYHNFADKRLSFAIPNFLNVASNVLFLVFGFWGLIHLTILPNLFPKCKFGGLHSLRKIYIVLFLGIFLTGFGSSYYHLQPDNVSLVWDRLPMAIAFMALFSMIIGEQISEDLALRVFGPLLVFGVFSIAYWHFTEQKGLGDLRIYILVQFLPILLIPLLLLLFKSPFTSTKAIWLAIFFYAGAKILELLDYQLFNLGIGVSGHSLKHVCAALGCGSLLWGLQNRTLKPT